MAQPVQDLRLYTRAEAVFAEDPAYHEAYRARQATPARSAGSLSAAARARQGRGPRAYRAQPADARTCVGRGAAAVAALRRLDTRHLASIDARASTLRAAMAAAERPSIARHLTELKAHRRRRLDGADRRRSRRRARQPPAAVRDAGGVASQADRRMVGGCNGADHTRAPVSRSAAAGRGNRGDLRPRTRSGAGRRIPAACGNAACTRRSASARPCSPGGCARRAATRSMTVTGCCFATAVLSPAPAAGGLPVPVRRPRSRPRRMSDTGSGRRPAQGCVRARSAGARYPLVDPQGVTFLYHGAADAVGLALLDPRPARQPALRAHRGHR